MKWIFFTLLGIAIAGLLLLKFVYAKSDSALGHLSGKIFDNNTFELNCTGIDRKAVSVIWKPDEKVRDTVLVQYGKTIGKIGYENGPNRFIVYADGKQFETGHLKLRDWYAYDYKIDFAKDSSGYALNFIGDGPDYVHAEHHYDGNGKLNGVQTFYNKNGKPQSRETWLHGKRNGKSFEYDENGNVMSEEEYVNGVEKHN